MATGAQLAKMDVALGPCVAAEGQRKSIVSGLAQDLGETPVQASALLTVLTGEAPTEALSLLVSAGEGRLYECAPRFLHAMADRSEQMLAATTTGEQFAALQLQLSEAWMAAVPWPTHFSGVQNRLHRLALARKARQDGRPLYFWFGPAVQVRTVVSGQGPRERGR